ncbi:MAG: NUDIX domain-containing protein [Phascolarctobacterium sp.]|nr:NUDIX domain-containing protein [Phascolarctobacterium sp.]
MHFTFCPQCGARLGSVPFGDDGRVPWCKACHKPFFDIFPVVTITMVINEKNEIALLRPKYMSEKYYNFVSGYVQPGEAMELCAAREVAEELGLEATDVQFRCSQWDAEQQLLLVGYTAHAHKGDFTLSEEINDALWVPAKEALGLVYPEGNITHRLLVDYLQEQQAAQP